MTRPIRETTPLRDPRQLLLVTPTASGFEKNVAYLGSTPKHFHFEGASAFRKELSGEMLGFARTVQFGEIRKFLNVTVLSYFL
jgi:hypothetical protein